MNPIVATGLVSIGKEFVLGSLTHLLSKPAAGASGTFPDLLRAIEDESSTDVATYLQLNRIESLDDAVRLRDRLVRNLMEKRQMESAQGLGEGPSDAELGVINNRKFELYVAGQGEERFDRGSEAGRIAYRIHQLNQVLALGIRYPSSPITQLLDLMRDHHQPHANWNLKFTL